MSGFFSVPFEYVLKLCALLFFRHRWMCLKNSHVLEWFCLHQPGRGLWLPLPLWALLLWWLSPWRRTEAQWAGVDPERRQVFCLFLQGEADVVNIISSYSFSSTFISLPLCTFPPPPPAVDSGVSCSFCKSPSFNSTANGDAEWQASLLWIDCELTEKWDVGLGWDCRQGKAGRRSQC